MVFEIRGKVALVTGGASGIGLNYAKELLRNGLKGVTLADVNLKFGQDAIEQIQREFGNGRAIFMLTDVTKITDFEEAFKKTVEKFGQIDILLNNAGVMNDAIWEKEIQINLNGVIHGMLLGMEKYLPKYQQGPNSLIVNISSVAGIMGIAQIPIYSATKHAIIGLTSSWGNPKFYEQSKVRVVAICPGITMTPLITEMSGRNLGEKYEEFIHTEASKLPTQEPNHVAKEVMNVIKYAPHGSIWIIEGGEPTYQYISPDRMTMKNNVLNKQ